MMHRIVIAFTVLVFCGLLTAPALGQDQRQGRRQDRGPKVELTIEEVDLFNEAWESARNPSILVMIGVVSGNKIIYSAPTTDVQRIGAPLRTQLIRAFPNALVALDISRARQAGLLAALERDMDKGIDANTAAGLSREFDADILFDVVLFPGDRRGEVVTTMRATNTKNAREIVCKTLRSVNYASNSQLGHVYGSHLAEAFGRGLVAGNGPRKYAETFEISIVAKSGRGGVNVRDLRAISDAIEDDLKHVAWSEVVPTLEGDELLGRLEIRYGRTINRLLRDLESMLEDEFEMGMTEIISRGTSTIVYLYPMEVPEWFELTDLENPNFDRSLRNRVEDILIAGMPKIGIVVGSDIDDPFDMFRGDADESGLGVDMEELQGELANLLSDLGFVVVDNQSVRRQLQRETINAERFRNANEMIESLGQLEAVDLIVHVNVSGKGEDRRLLTRLVDVGQARLLGSERWPNKSANRLSAYPVSSENPDDVARFIIGRLMARWDRLAKNAVATTEIRVREMETPQQLLGLVDLFEGSIAGVRGTTDVQIFGNTGSFEVLHKGDFDSILFNAIDRIGHAYPGAEIQIMGGFVAVNMNPDYLSEEERAQLRNARVANKAEAEQEDHADQAPGSRQDSGDISGADFRAKLRAASESVFMVGIEIDGKFMTSGTGWIGQEGVLVTNAHVALGLRDTVAQLGEWGVEGSRIKLIALGGSDSSIRLVLAGNSSVHTTYFESSKENERLAIARIEKAYAAAERDLAEAGIENREQREAYLARALQAEVMSVGLSLPVTAGDVAMFNVVSGQTPEPLEIIPAEQVEKAIMPADVIAYIGFPAENLEKLSNDGQVAQLIDIGNVMGMTEFSTKPGTSATRRLLHYDLVTAGGASGSPLFDGEGRVIGLNCAGSYVGVDESVATSRRIRTGVAFGQRADLIHELFAGKSRQIEVLRAD